MMANRGMYRIAMVKIKFVTFGPSTATSATASKMAGKANRMSNRRISSRSNQPPANPMANPTVRPTTSANPTDGNATPSETRVPATTRLSTSRPIESVPNANRVDGGASVLAANTRVGSYGASQGPTTATAPSSKITNPATTT